MLPQNDLEREKYEARLKYQRDEASRMHDAKERGELMGRVQLTERLLNQAPTPRETLRAMMLEQLRELADRLEAQLVGRT